MCVCNFPTLMHQSIQKFCFYKFSGEKKKKRKENLFLKGIFPNCLEELPTVVTSREKAKSDDRIFTF
jgi:hypothetical protein